MAKDPFSPFHLEASWHKVLKEELQKPYIAQLAAFVEKEYAASKTPIYPPKDLIFNAFNTTPFQKTQVVIVGQDPYHGPGQAHGLSFSVPPGIPLPPSLQNIFKELKTDLNVSMPKTGCLIPWAKQGVLLLNATLTVRQGEPMSHHGIGWEQFTDAAIYALSQREDPVIFVLWGKSAQDKCRFLRTPSNHDYILTAAHPSPFSAHHGFFGCRHFSKINQLLEQQGKEPIQWALD
jgi:uracil-DNA glycosylase